MLSCLPFSLCRLIYHDLFRDPLNWSQTGEALPGGPLGALQAMCRRTHPGPVTIALDSLSWLLLHIPCTALCQALGALSRQHAHPGETPLRPSHIPSAVKEQAPFHPKKKKNTLQSSSWALLHLFTVYSQSRLFRDAIYQSLYCFFSKFFLSHWFHSFTQKIRITQRVRYNSR